MVYIGKYVGKLPDLDAIGALGVGAYLHGGRAWGCYRKDLLPLADSGLIRVPPNGMVARIRAMARAAWKGIADGQLQGFSLFGPASERISKWIEEYLAMRIDPS